MTNVAEQHVTGAAPPPASANGTSANGASSNGASAGAGVSAFSREAQVVLLGARARCPERAEQRLHALLRRELDWERVCAMARRHRVAALLHRRLRAGSFAAAVPEGVQGRLKACFRQNSLRGLRQTRGLVQVLARLREHDIPALPFKGATLAERIYDDVALRRFGDLDILVPPADVLRAKRLLAEQGFRALKEMNAREEAAYLRREKSYELARGDLVVELHWAFLHPMHSFRLDPARVWKRAERLPLGGAQVPVMAPEDLVLYLCAHGAKHFWGRLSWICDVAACLHAYRDRFCWPALLRRARALDAGRILLLGLHLAAELQGAPCPPAVLQAARSNAAVEDLNRRVRGRLFEERDADRSGLELRDALFHLKMRERLRDKGPYVRQLGRLAVTPTDRDRAWLDLPPAWHGAYYAVRPVRLCRDGLARLFSGLWPAW